MSLFGWAGTLLTLLGVGGLAMSKNKRDRHEAFLICVTGGVAWALHAWRNEDWPLLVNTLILLGVNTIGAARHNPDRGTE